METTPATATPPPATAPKKSFRAILRQIRDEKTGLLPLLVVVATCAILVIPLYNILGLPGIYLSNFFLSMDCANNSWTCGLWLAILAASGPILLGVLLLIFNHRLRHLLAKAKIPLEFDFLVLPVLATLFFTIAWSGIAFHFFEREGLVLDGYFPIVFGALIFSLGRWGGILKEKAAGLFAPRDKIPAKFRALALFGGIVVIGFLLGGIHAPQRDQILAILAVLLGWWMFTVVPRTAATAPAPAPMGLWAWIPLMAIASLVGLAERAFAAGPCAHETKMDFFDCEQAHHHGATAGTAGVVAILAGGGTGKLTDAGKDEELRRLKKGLEDSEKAKYDRDNPRPLTKEEREKREIEWYEAKSKFEDEQEREREEEELFRDTFFLFGTGLGGGPPDSGPAKPLSYQDALKRLQDRGELPPKTPDPDDVTAATKIGRFIQGIPYDWSIQKGIDTVTQGAQDVTRKIQQAGDLAQIQKASGGIVDADLLSGKSSSSNSDPSKNMPDPDEFKKRPLPP